MSTPDFTQHATEIMETISRRQDTRSALTYSDPVTVARDVIATALRATYDLAQEDLRREIASVPPKIMPMPPQPLTVAELVVEVERVIATVQDGAEEIAAKIEAVQRALASRESPHSRRDGLVAMGWRQVDGDKKLYACPSCKALVQDHNGEPEDHRRSH